MNKVKYKIIELDKNDYPEKLKQIKKMPKKLYAIGNVDLLFEDSFAIVGTRRITEYGKEICTNFAKEFALRNIPVVSGMAIGTDTVAHKVTLECFGKTIAVLGSGFNFIYPKKNKELFYEILKNNGLVLTEYEENVEPLKENFPNRNRIITAISEGVLVIEAGFRSGTSITARNAKEQGKKVFAIPGSLNSSVGVGVNNLIKKGAILTTSIEDILINYPQFMNKKRKTYIQKSKKVNNKYEKIYKLLENNGKYFEEIIQETNFEFKRLLQILINMELENLIYQEKSGKYKIKEK